MFAIIDPIAIAAVAQALTRNPKERNWRIGIPREFSKLISSTAYRVDADIGKRALRIPWLSGVCGTTLSDKLVATQYHPGR